MTTFLIAAALLGLERIFYIFVSRRPDVVRSAERFSIDPTHVVQAVFFGLKILQIGVFVWWCAVFGDGSIWPTALSPAVAVCAAALIVAGQALSTSVFYRLGWTGAFYGGEFGRAVPHVRGFPFSWFPHPQYVGGALTVWGVFLALRFPSPDWIVLPALETIYYVIGAKLEQAGPHVRAAEAKARSASSAIADSAG